MPDKTYHLLTREDGSTVLYYTLGDDPSRHIIYDTLDDIEQQVRDLATRVGKHPNAQNLRQVFNGVELTEIDILREIAKKVLEAHNAGDLWIDGIYGASLLDESQKLALEWQSAYGK